MDWIKDCDVENTGFTEHGQRKDYYVRWTSPFNFQYYWLHPKENRWVEEPEQVGMGFFPTLREALETLSKAPAPPGVLKGDGTQQTPKASE